MMTDVDARKPQTDLIEVGKRLSALGQIGIAAERFPAYVNSILRPHRVDVILLTCVVSGQGVHRMGDRSVNVGPGSVGITLYGQEHDLLTEDTGMDVINLYLDLKRHPLPVLPAPWNRTLASMLAPHPGLVRQHNQRIDFILDENQHAFQPLLWLLQEQEKALPAHVAMIRQLVVIFLVACCRVAEHSGWASSVDSRPNDPQWLEEIRCFIDRCYDRPIGLPDLTKRSGVSAEHLCRSFRRYTGQSPVAYLIDRRLQAAMWLLRTDTASITDIAHQCGFSELSFFNRKFKSASGQTPTQYRNQTVNS